MNYQVCFFQKFSELPIQYCLFYSYPSILPFILYPSLSFGKPYMDKFDEAFI